MNALNHYIAMPAILDEQFPELRLFVSGIALVVLGLMLVALLPWRVLHWPVTIGSWALPIGFLADLQWRLHQFGHSLNPEAAFRLPAFTPRVIGPTVMMNFNVTALPGLGLTLFVLSALAFTIGPRIPLPTTGGRRRAVVTAAVTGLSLLCALAVPSLAAFAFPSSSPAPSLLPAPAFDLARVIAAAPAGAVIDVPPGRRAGPLVLSRSVTLRGVGRSTIDGQGRGDVIVITGDDVRLEGVVIRGSALAFSSEAAGVVVRGARAVVRDNRIEEVLFGLWLAGSRDALIERNTVSTADLAVERRGHAVYLWKAARSRLIDNQILRGKDGFYMSFSDDNLVERNIVLGCRYGIHYMYSSRYTFRSNVFRGNIVGAAVMYSSDVTLVGNTSRAAARPRPARA